MPTFEPADPDYAARVRASFARQLVMATLGATLRHVAPGEIEIEMPFRSDLSQQHGFLHAGSVTPIVDSACGYAAFSLMPADTGVLTIEYKVNFLAPASGSLMVARGRVIKPGRTVTVTTGEVYAIQDDQEKLVTLMQATIMTVRDRPDVTE